MIENVVSAMAMAMTPATTANTGFRKSARIKPSSQNGFDYQTITPAKMPDQPTARERRRQQATT